MTWGLTAVGVAAGSAALAADQANTNAARAASASNTASMNDYTNSVKQLSEQNRSIELTNNINMIRAGYQASLVQLQTARLKEQAAVAGWSTSKSAQVALSQADAGAAASGNVGASVDAVANNIKKKSDEAQIGIDIAWQQTEENQNINLTALMTQAYDAQQSPNSIPDVGVVNIRSAQQTSPLLAAGIAGLSTYANSKFSLNTSQANPNVARGTLDGLSLPNG
jgi:hypothetical protein